MSNIVVRQMAKELKKASSEHEAPIWKKLAELALKPTIARRNINVNKIDKLTKDNDVVVVPVLDQPSMVTPFPVGYCFIMFSKLRILPPDSIIFVAAAFDIENEQSVIL